MAGFIIETPNQCWHVAAAGKTCFLAEYPSRTTTPPHVFSTRADARGVLDKLKTDNRGEKLRIVEIP
ncbi:MAG: hypothetical protein PHE17_14895 [Thiothrix sp.]|uniref:hypothetical protein n=1 Tax=Thiothrix sp. TaxID=1032 RepID=UPI0026372FE1|nr:hypothetical protein [Thiothrix sp.]MDD5394299.1 hypothetical protein [Thiothrix sp.]